MSLLQICPSFLLSSLISSSGILYFISSMLLLLFFVASFVAEFTKSRYYTKGALSYMLTSRGIVLSEHNRLGITRI